MESSSSRCLLSTRGFPASAVGYTGGYLESWLHSESFHCLSFRRILICQCRYGSSCSPYLSSLGKVRSRQGALDEVAADKNHLAQMVILLGSPPPQLLTDSGSRTLVFFNEDGTAKGEVQNKTLESVLGSSLE
jgi:hypothetical protein